MQVSKLLRDRVHTRMEGIGLSRGQGFILFRLGHEDGLPQTELARQTMVRPATLTEILQRMESAGLVERRPDPADGRVSRVFLTPHGDVARRPADEELRQTSTRVERALDAIVDGLALAIGLRPPHTAGHEQRVAGLLPDIGKALLVPTEIRGKPGRLSELEMALLREHPKAGYGVLKGPEPRAGGRDGVPAPRAARWPRLPAGSQRGRDPP